ncbi:MAG: hypothetical protein RID94_05355 [Miltoncostaeaceae bacterium]
MSDRPVGPATTTGLSRLAVVARGLGDGTWHDQLVSYGARAVDEPSAPPTYEQVAVAGMAAVAELLDEGFAVADRLTRVFRVDPDDMPSVAVESFDGLRAAIAARDPEEVQDFVDLLAEMFGPSHG